MENDKTDCGCGSDCCQPKKSKLWMKIVLVVVILAAVAIVTFKFVGKNMAEPVPVTDTVSATQPSSCDTTCVKTCTKITTPGQNPPCCPQAKH